MSAQKKRRVKEKDRAAKQQQRETLRRDQNLEIAEDENLELLLVQPEYLEVEPVEAENLNDSFTTPVAKRKADQMNDSFTTPVAKRKAVSRVKQNMPRSREKFVDVLCMLVECFPPKAINSVRGAYNHNKVPKSLTL